MIRRTRDCLGCKSCALQMFWLTYLLKEDVKCFGLSLEETHVENRWRVGDQLTVMWQVQNRLDQLSCGESWSPSLHLFWTCVSSRDTPQLRWSSTLHLFSTCVSSRDTPQLSWSPTLHLFWTCVSCRDTTQLRWSPTLHLFWTCVSSRDTPQLRWSPTLHLLSTCVSSRDTTQLTYLLTNSTTIYKAP